VGWASRNKSDANFVRFRVLVWFLVPNCEFGKAVTRPDEQHVETPPPGVVQHPVERWAACLRAAEPVVYVLVLLRHAQPTTLRVLAEFPQLRLRVLIYSRDTNIKSSTFHRSLLLLSVSLSSEWAPQPIPSHKANGRFWSKQIQARPDLVFQQLP